MKSFQENKATSETIGTSNIDTKSTFILQYKKRYIGAKAKLYQATLNVMLFLITTGNLSKKKQHTTTSR